MGETKPGFSIPNVQDNSDSWGPCVLPNVFNDVPYAPFNKTDKVGKAADWQASSNFPNRFGNRYRDSSQSTVQTAFNYFYADGELPAAHLRRRSSFLRLLASRLGRLYTRG